jgi:hypothetical protein
MNQRQFIILLIAVIISSFLGGMSIQLVTVASSVTAKESVNYLYEIRAKALHLIGKDNKVRTSFYLGVHDASQLVLYDREGTNRLNFGLAPAGNPGMSFNDNGFNKLIDIDTSYNRASVSIWDSKKNILWEAPHTTHTK